ncbi:hypothetical protein [Anderseniella sp. Alg231-50]|uniref:hypothetical protein n=1 Tax=Anderseniella sp. Alg231-50 TaxID=1922226 RepID=UPI000D54B97D
MNTSFSNDASSGNTVRAGNGQLFPVSVCADAAADGDLIDNGVMSNIVFTMRSEPGRVSCDGN